MHFIKFITHKWVYGLYLLLDVTSRIRLITHCKIIAIQSVLCLREIVQILLVEGALLLRVSSDKYQLMISLALSWNPKIFAQGKRI